METPSVEELLRARLHEAGLTPRAVDAVWPRWWSADAEGSVSATAELRYTLARRLGLPPQSLFEDKPKFVWRSDAKFKNLGELNDLEARVLASFCVGVGRHLVAALHDNGTTRDLAPLPSAIDLRRILLQQVPAIDLHALLVLCWGLQLSVIQLRLFPLKRKGLHAVTTRSGERFAIMIGQESRFRAQVCFWIAHELGHIALGHLGDSCALLDVEDPTEHTGDDEELAADSYALELLTGWPDPQIEVNAVAYNASQLANAVRAAAQEHAIDPAVLALCAAHRDDRWSEAFGALKILGDEDDVPVRVNELAVTQIDLDSLSPDNREFLRTVMGLS